MKRILFTAFCMLLLIIPTAAQVDKTLPQTFVSDDEQMTLRYPSGWVAESESTGEVIVGTSREMFGFNGNRLRSGDAALLIVFPGANDDFIDAEDIYASGEPVITLNRLVETLNAETNGLFVEFAEVEATTLGGESAALTTGKVGENDAMLIVIDYGDDMFSFIIGVVASDEMGKYAPKLVAIAESVNFAGL